MKNHYLVIYLYTAFVIHVKLFRITVKRQVLFIEILLPGETEL
jgi:hypothetical protein